MTGPTINRGGLKQSYETPTDFILAVEKRFGKLTFDLAAAADNTKCVDYFTKEQDSLAQQWFKLPGLLWLNPEFADITPWAAKCAAESELGAPPILLLTPASVGANWFKNFVLPSAAVIPLNGRIKFVGEKDYYPKDLMLSVYWRGIAGFQTPWTWNKK